MVSVRYNRRPVRRLSRILLNAMTVLSLLICLAALALWARSYWLAHEFGWVASPRSGGESFVWNLTSAEGRFRIMVGPLAPGMVPRYMRDGWTWRPLNGRPHDIARSTHVNRWGFASRPIIGPVGRLAVIDFPAWLPTTLFALTPAIRLALAVRRGPRLREGHCERCGYDLRATPERCPECGTIPAR